MSSNEPSIENVSGKAETTDDIESSSNRDTSSNNESSFDPNTDFLDDEEYNIIFDAIVKNSPKNVEDFLKIKDWDLDANEETVMTGFNFLLKNEENFIEETLIVAIKKGLSDIVEKILSFNVDMDVIHDLRLFNQSPINHAIEIHNLKIVKILLRHNFDVNHETFIGSLPIQVAVDKEDIEIIKELLKNGANPDVFGKTSKTPLLEALERKRLDIVKILIENGADINARSEKGITSLHLTAINGNLEIVQFLLKNGANIDCVDYCKLTPLHFATNFTDAEGDAEVLKTLLINGANANRRCHCYSTAFAEAVDKTTRVYFFDYASDLDLNIRDYRGNTPFEDDLKCNKISSAKMIAYYLSL